MKPNILASLIVVSIVILMVFIILFISFSIVFKYKSNTYTGYYSFSSKSNNSYLLKPLVKLVNYIITYNETSDYEILNSTECGKASHASNLKIKRIIFGTQAAPHSYPWTVSLRVIKDRTLYDHFCGAVLITPRFILTAAHCVVNKSVDNLIAVFGLHIRNDISEYALKNSYKIINIKIHPNYNQSTSDNDIAILKLIKNVHLNENVSTICLPNQETSDKYINRNALLTGWGLSNNTINTELQQTSISLIDNDDKMCKSYLNNLNKESILCAVNSENHSNACSGDSGGPLAVYEDNKWLLIGIVSYVLAKPNNYLNSPIECDPKAPSFYSRISFHLEWIFENIKLN